MTSQDVSSTKRVPFEFAIMNPEDINQVIEILVAAFSGPTQDVLYPGHKTDPQGFRDCIRADWFNITRDHGLRRWGCVARTDTGEIVATSIWSVHPTLAPGQEPAKPPELVQWDGCDMQLRREFRQGMRERREKYYAGRAYYHIEGLATKPEYQGMGAMSLTLKHIIKEAETAGVPIHIEASEKGLPVYTKYGWRIVDKIEAKGITNMIMTRDPQQRTVVGL